MGAYIKYHTFVFALVLCERSQTIKLSKLTYRTVWWCETLSIQLHYCNKQRKYVHEHTRRHKKNSFCSVMFHLDSMIHAKTPRPTGSCGVQTPRKPHFLETSQNYSTWYYALKAWRVTKANQMTSQAFPSYQLFGCQVLSLPSVSNSRWSGLESKTGSVVQECV